MSEHSFYPGFVKKDDGKNSINLKITVSIDHDATENYMELIEDTLNNLANDQSINGSIEINVDGGDNDLELILDCFNSGYYSDKELEDQIKEVIRLSGLKVLRTEEVI